MVTQRVFSLSLLFTFLCLASTLVWLAGQGEKMNFPDVGGVSSSSQHPLAIAGMTYDNYSDGVLTSRIKVEKMQVRPRRFGIFRIQAVNEVALIKARIDLYSAPSASSSKAGESEELSLTAGLTEGVSGLADLRGMGRISRAVIDSLFLNVFRNQASGLHLQSLRAILDLKNRTADFAIARLIGHQGDFQLDTALLQWDERHKIFYVPGEYQLTSQAGVQRGTGAVIDADLNLRPIPGGTPPQTWP